VLLGITAQQAQACRATKPSWVGAYAQPVDNGGASSFEDQTIRNVVRVGFGGSRVRVRMSNANGTQPLTLRNVHVGLAGEGAAVSGANRAVTFAGETSVTVPPGQSALSDGVPLEVPPSGALAVSLHVPAAVEGTGGHGPAISYTASGDHAGDTDGGAFGASSTKGYFAMAVDVWAPNDGLIVGLGDSITAGPGGVGWPVLLAERVRQWAATGGPCYSVTGVGIVGNAVTYDSRFPGLSFGLSAQHRLQQDVLDQTNLAAVLMMEGINDIGNAGSTSPVPLEEIERGLGAIIERVRAEDAAILVSPLTPAGDLTQPAINPSLHYSTPSGVQERHDLNDWIRGESGAYSPAFDFEPVVADPQEPDHLNPDYNGALLDRTAGLGPVGDNLHPNAAGQQAMSDSIDLPTIDQLIRKAARPRGEQP
jgi:lysophospholipase L1-like esterase